MSERLLADLDMHELDPTDAYMQELWDAMSQIKFEDAKAHKVLMGLMCMAYVAGRIRERKVIAMKGILSVKGN